MNKLLLNSELRRLREGRKERSEAYCNLIL